MDNWVQDKDGIVDYFEAMEHEKTKYTKNTIKDIKENSGGIIEIDGEKVGVYKNEEGKNYLIKPVCTHLGCMLEWNDADKTWDCPCHGSRFDKFGKNILGPAIKDLEIYSIDK